MEKGRRLTETLGRMSARPLTIGLAAVFLLVAISSAVSIVDATKTRTDVQKLVSEGEEALVLVGRIGRALAQERALVLEALTEPTTALGQATASLALIEESLSRDLSLLERRLEPEEREDWERIRSELAQVRGELVRALEEIAAGAAGEAEDRLDAAAVAAARVHAALDGFALRNELDAKGLLARARKQLDRLVLVQVGMTIVLLAAIGFISVSVERLVAHHVRRIEESNRDLDAFAGRLAHDVRNALSPIHLAGNILRGTKDPATVAVVADQLVRGTVRARRMLDGLLAFSRVEAEPRVGCARVDAACAEVLEEVEPLARRVRADVSQRVEPSTVALPPELLHLVLANVVGNAVKFIEGRELRRVQIRGTVCAGDYSLDVEDTGPGIPNDAIRSIFEPFYRAPGVEADGTGIGLATVRRVVDAYGGAVGVRSTLGRGSTFRITLPLTQGAARRAERVA